MSRLKRRLANSFVVSMILSQLNWALQWFGVVIAWPDRKSRPFVLHRINYRIVCSVLLLIISSIEMTRVGIEIRLCVPVVVSLVILWLDRRKFRYELMDMLIAYGKCVDAPDNERDST